MAGASVTLMKLDATLKQWLSAPCDTPALSVHEPFETVEYTEVVHRPDAAETRVSYKNESDPAWATMTDNQLSLQNMVYLIDQMSEIIIENEVPFCELDAHAGDGDFGMSVAKGFKQLKTEWKDILAHSSGSIGSFLDACSLIIMEHCGGASGPIWGSAFRAASRQVGDKQTLSIEAFADMMAARGTP